MKSLLTYDEIEDIGEYAIANYDKKKHRTNYLCVDIEGFMTEALKLIIQYENIAEDNPGKILSNRTELIEVSKFLGHSTIATTANIYAHLDMSNKEHTASVMSDILAGMNTTKAPK